MTSPGIGGTTIGSHLRPEPFQLEQTAQDAGAKQGLNIVKDSLQISLITTAEQPGYKYQNDPKRPILPMFIQVSVYRQDKGDQPWLQLFDQLKQKLPDLLKGQLEKQLELPENKRDPRFEGLRKGLEFAAKGLHWLRGATKGLTLNEEDKRKREEAYVEENLSYFNEMLKAYTKVVNQLPATSEDRAVLTQFVQKVPKILFSISQKRGKAEAGLIKLQDHKILSEIEEVKSYLHKNLTKDKLLVPDFMIDFLEVIHQLSFKGLNVHLFKMLNEYSAQLSGANGDVSLIGSSLSSLGAKVLRLFPETIFDKERQSLINVLISGALALFLQGVQKQEFGFRLIIGMLVASKFVVKMGSLWLKGLLYTQNQANMIADSVIGLAMSALIVFTDFKALKDRDRDELLALLQAPMRLLVKRFLNDMDQVQEEDDWGYLKVFLKKMDSHLRVDPFLIVEECKEGLGRLDIDLAKFVEDLNGINTVVYLIHSQMGEFHKDEEKLAVMQRPA